MSSLILQKAKNILNVKNNNLLINGNFNIWERGWEFFSSGYTADRWAVAAFNSNNECMVHRIASGGTIDNNAYAIRIITMQNNSYFILTQILETLDLTPIKGDVVTLSFYARIASTVSRFNTANTWTGNIYARACYSTAIDNILYNKTTVTGSVIDSQVSSSWTKYTVTFTIPTNAQTMAIEIMPKNTTTLPKFAMLDITQVKLEAGVVATPMPEIPYVTELNQCKRYYQQSNQKLSTGGAIGKNFNVSTPLSSRIRTSNPLITIEDRSENVGAISATVDTNKEKLSIETQSRAPFSALNLSSIVIDDEIPYAAIPSVVSGIYVTRNLSQINVFWSGANNNNSDITNYEIKYGLESDNLSDQISVTGSTAQSGSLTGLNPYTTYYLKVNATNNIGDGPLSALITSGPIAFPPQAVTNVSGIWGFGISTIIGTKPNNDGGVPITGYVLERDTINTFSSPSRVRIINSVDSSSRNSPLRYIVAHGVDTSPTYYYRIAGINPAGTGIWSSTFSLNKSAPSEPKNLQTTVRDKSITLTWINPLIDNGSRPTGSIVQYHTGINPLVFSNPSQLITPNRSVSLTGLTNNINYYLRVAEINTFGSGTWSTVVTGVPFRPISPPAAPINLTATWPQVLSEDKKIFVNWDAPSDNGGSKIINYHIICDTSSSFNTVNLRNFKTLNDISEYYINSLDNNYTYYIKVAGINVSGTGTYTSTVSLAEAVPLSPNNINVTAGDTVVSVRWNKPISNGSEIDFYTIKYSTSSNFTSPVSITGISGTLAQYNVSGLVNDTTYYFRMNAVNAVGSSVDSAETPFATPRPPILPPGPPRLLTSRTSASSAEIRIASVANNGNSAITGYELIYSLSSGLSNPISIRQISNTITLNNLQNVDYYGRVLAINVSGTGSFTPFTLSPYITAPSVPTNFTITPGTGSLTLSWVAPTPGSGYGYSNSIRYRLSTDSSVSDIYTTGTSQTITGLAENKSYIYNLYSINGANLSSSPLTASATTLGSPPPIAYIYTISCNCNPYNKSQNTSLYPLPASWPSINRSCIRCDGDYKKTIRVFISINNSPWIFIGGNRWVQGAPGCFRVTSLAQYSQFLFRKPFVNQVRVELRWDNGRIARLGVHPGFDIRLLAKNNYMIMHNSGEGGASPWGLNLNVFVDPALYEYVLSTT